MSEQKDKIRRQPVESAVGPFGGRGPGGGMIGPTEKAKDFKGTMRTFVQYLQPYRDAIIVVFLFAIGSTVFTILGPKILGNATTKIFEGVMAKKMGVPNAAIDFAYVQNIVILLLGLFIISALFSYIQGYIMAGVSQKVTYDLRKKISEKINHMPLKYFDTKTHGEVLSRVTNDVDTVNTTLNQSLTQIITSLTTIIGVLIMMFSINWLMTLIALLMLPVSMTFIMMVVKASQKHFKKQQVYLGHINGHVEEMYAGHTVMKAFNGETRSLQEFNTLNDELYDSAWKSQFFSGMMMPIMMFIGNLGYVAVAILGGYFTIRQTIQVGDIQAFIQYVRSFTQPISQVANIANVLQSTTAAAERVFEFLDEEEEIPEATYPVQLQNVYGSVEFKNVQFGYNPDKIIINSFSASISPGQKVAIVGPTGAGKTTIVKLLMRFYDVTSGSILVDGYDIQSFRRHDLRDNFGMVLQDSWLFNGTIMENIRYGRLGATDEEVVAAAKAAHADSFIRTLPGGYKMVINEEVRNVSEGQKQLLTIARAILSDPAILILDEATSSVDTRTELLIQKAMENLMQDRTSFIIAHRLSTIRDADIILVMKDGDIVEQGSHLDLLSQNGLYASLYNSQFESAQIFQSA